MRPSTYGSEMGHRPSKSDPKTKTVLEYYNTGVQTHDYESFLV